MNEWRDAFLQDIANVIAPQCKKKTKRKKESRSWWMDVRVGGVRLVYEMKLLSRKTLTPKHHVFLWGQKRTAASGRRSDGRKSKKKMNAEQSCFRVCVRWDVLRCPDIRMVALWWSVTEQEGINSETPCVLMGGKRMTEKQENKCIFPRAVYKCTIWTQDGLELKLVNFEKEKTTG